MDPLSEQDHHPMKHFSNKALRALAAVVLGLALWSSPQAQAQDRKVLNLAFINAETTIDPAKISDLYSRAITAHIFEALYTYDHLARPSKPKPLIADGMPVASEDFRTWTVKIKPGIYFQDDPVFKGKKREVTAQDFVYPFQRIADPANKSPLWGWIGTFELLGLAQQRQMALDGKKPFDYDAPIEGLKVLDRYTIQYKLKAPDPRLTTGILAGSDLTGAQAREVVEFYGDKIDEHPVGTGPFKLKQWRRSSLIVLERNPDYREVLYDAEPAADDAQGQELLAHMKGRKIPMVDEVRIAVIPESQPFWLSFLNAQVDALVTLTGSVPNEFVNQAMPNGKVAPNLAKRGIVGRQQVNADVGYVFFNMEDPVVGGYTPEKVALRRAIALAYDVEREIRTIRRGQAVPAQSNIVPHTYGYDPSYKSEMGDYDPARAKALLDLYGYKDVDGDGYRELPDGKPLVIKRSTLPEQVYREYDTLWKKNMDAVGIRTVFSVQKFAESLKQARAGKLQVWSLANSAAGPDGQGALQRFDSTQIGGQNLARFKNARMDEIYKQLSSLPDGPERLALFKEAKQISVAYMPYKGLGHRQSTDLWYPWVIGYKRPLVWQEWMHMVDIDPSKKPAP
jgi:ABC-type transport system substrate-binding protein